MKKVVILLSILLSISCLQAQTAAQKYNAAMKAYQSHEYAQANNLFNDFFSEYQLTDGLYATAKYYSADALLNIGEYNAAAAGFEFFINHFAWSQFRDEALYKLGIIYFRQDEFELSRDRLRKLLSEYPGSDLAGSALYWIGESYSKQNKLQDAVRFLKSAIANQQNNKFIDYSIYTLGSVYEKMGDYKDAVAYYDTLLSYHSNSPLSTAAHIRIGVCYFKLKEYNASVIELNNPVLKELPDEVYAKSLYLLANSYYRTSDYPNAEKVFLEIINKYPSSEEIRESKYGLAWTYFQEKKYNDAYQVFNNLSTGNDSLAEKSFYWKAESKRYAGQGNEAFKIYQDFIKKYPNSSMIKGVEYQIGVVYYNSKNFNLALKYLNSAVETSDSSFKAKAYTLMGEIELDNKNFNSAAGYFKNAMDVPGISNDLVYRSMLGLGISYYYLHEYAIAEKYLSDLYSKDAEFEKDKVNFYLAECYYSAGDYSKAIARYNQVSGDDEEIGSMALYGKAYSYFEMRKYEEAANVFSEFTRRYPNSSRLLDAELRLADSYYGSKNFAASSNVYKNIIGKNNRVFDNPYDYYQYAQALYRANEFDQAISEFQAIAQKFPSSEYADKSLYVIGWIHFQQGDYNAAMDSYRNVLSRYPNSSIASQIYYSIGDCYYNLANYDSAIVNYEYVMTQYPSSPHVYDAVNGIQDAYVVEGHPQKAINFINQYLSTNPSSNFADQISYKVGDIYYSMHDYKDASTSYTQFIANYPKSKLVPQAYFWIGKCNENLNQFPQALFNFNMVFNSFPASESAPAAVIEIGNIYNMQKNYGAALNIYDQALKSLPDTKRFPEILFNKGMTLITSNDSVDAQSVFNQVIQSYSHTIFSEKSKLELGIIALRSGQYDTSITYFQGLAQNRTDEIGAQAQYYYGVALFNQGNYTDAINAFLLVQTSFPGYDEWVTKSYLKLGDCYAKTQNYVQAKQMYQLVYKNHRNDDFGKEARIKLRKLK